MSTLPFVLAPVTVASVTRPSPSFVRVEFAGDALADFGVDGPYYDQRIKLIFPPEAGALPDLGAADADWYTRWLALPDDERGAMRTYSVLEVHGSGAETRLVVDLVLHLEPGATGPASSWASRAQLGDQVLLVGPRRGAPFGGIEFAPGDAERLLLVADETALPALSRILADLPTEAVGNAFCEVPLADDARDLEGPSGVDVTWLPREGAEIGSLVTSKVLAHLGAAATETTFADVVDDHVWETPSYSTFDEQEQASGGVGLPGLYAWIAGESRVVTTLRRHLVGDVGLDRSQVAFMGYWRESVAMGR